MADRAVSLLQYHERRLGTARGGREKEFFCPFCLDREGSESSKRKLYVNMASGKVYCFRCEYGADGLRKFLRDLNSGRLTFEELRLLREEGRPPSEALSKAVAAALSHAKKVLRGREGAVSLDSLKPVPLPKEYMPLWQNPHPLVKLGYEYLTVARGIPAGYAWLYDIGYCPVGTYRKRLVFPVCQGGRQVYFTTRYCGDHFQKSLNPPNQAGYFSRDSCWLNYDRCVGAELVAVVEGPFDMLALPHAVSAMGTAVSETQIVLLEGMAASGTKEFVLVQDADAGKKTDALYRRMVGRLPKVTVLSLEWGDPHDRRNEMATLLEQRGEPGFSERVAARFRRSK